MPENANPPVLDGDPLVEIPCNNTKRKRNMVEEHVGSSKDMITPPNSTVRKISGGIDSNNDVAGMTGVPLSPELSSPIASCRAKKQKSDGSSRSNGNLTLHELLQSLERRKINGEMTKKPPYSYATLIGLAILQSRDGKLTLSQIYNWISVHFPYYKQKDAGWQNSIRHNLSLNEAFIKTEKSCDGKGHFWEVKWGYETKFFKGETGSYEQLRMKLQNIDRFFEAASNPKEEESLKDQLLLSSNNIPSHKSDPEYESDDDIALLRMNSSPTAMPSHAKLSLADYTEPELLVPETQKNNYNSLSPPYTMKKFHTNFELPKITGDTKDNSLFFGSAHNNYGGVLSNSAHNTFISTQDFKKYTCSFNSSFEEHSPMADASANNSLLDPVFDDSLDVDPPHDVQQSPQPTYRQQASQLQQNDLLRTPGTTQQQNLMRTPCRFITTPKDGNSTLKRWQTPSHLFEDIYCSPMFKCLAGTASKDLTTPGGTNAKVLSPRKISSTAVDSANRTKFVTGGLFGVDVYAVWKRATEELARNNTNQAKNLDKPFTYKGVVSQGDSDSKDNGKGKN